MEEKNKLIFLMKSMQTFTLQCALKGGEHIEVLEQYEWEEVCHWVKYSDTSLLFSTVV